MTGEANLGIQTTGTRVHKSLGGVGAHLDMACVNDNYGRRIQDADLLDESGKEGEFLYNRLSDSTWSPTNASNMTDGRAPGRI